MGWSWRSSFNKSQSRSGTAQHSTARVHWHSQHYFLLTTKWHGQDRTAITATFHWHIQHYFPLKTRWHEQDRTAIITGTLSFLIKFTLNQTCLWSLCIFPAPMTTLRGRGSAAPGQNPPVWGRWWTGQRLCLHNDNISAVNGWNALTGLALSKDVLSSR